MDPVCLEFIVGRIYRPLYPNLELHTRTPLNNQAGMPTRTCTHTKTAQLNKFLWGNFAPVDGDFYAASLPVTEGRIPPELAGMFMRNGG